MLAKKLDMQMLKKLPALLDLQRAVSAERIERRADLLKKIEQASSDFNSADAKLVAKASPIEKEIAQLRARLTELEEELAPLVDARLSATFVSNSKVKELQALLRADAAEDFQDFERSLEATRDQIKNNGIFSNEVLRRFRPQLATHVRVVEALQLTLEASRKASAVVLHVDDVAAALNDVRDHLRAEGIELVQP